MTDDEREPSRDMDPFTALAHAARFFRDLDRTFAETNAVMATAAQMVAELERFNAALLAEDRAAQTLDAIIRRNPTVLTPRSSTCASA